MGLSAVTLASLWSRGTPPAAALAAALAVGALAGSLNGSLVSKLMLPPFIATLGTLSIARGISYWVTGGINISMSSWEERGGSWLFSALGNCSVLVMALLAAAAAAMMARSRWGRAVYAIGGNEEAARFCGIPVPRTKVLIYALAGAASALAGCAYALRYGSAGVAVGNGYELQIIAACAVGGTSFSGGRGSIAGAVVGAAILQALRETLIQAHVQDTYVEIAYGVMIVFSVAMESAPWMRRKTERRTGP